MRRALIATMLLLGLATARAADDVTVETDLAYWTGEGRDEKKHRLDLYVPKGEGPFPVLVFVHGGGWKMGDKALYRHVGQTFAKKGILTAVPSYRLSPAVQHPEHARDVARVVSWLRVNAKAHKGDPAAIHLSGQSAGGHLAALVALDPRYLKEVGLDASALKGVIPVSGVYGIGLRAFRDVFPDAAQEAEPLHHVGDVKQKPPFLVAWGDNDPINLRAGGKAFARKLEDSGAKVDWLEVKDRGHITIVTKIGSDDDELTAAVARFVLGR